MAYGDKKIFPIDLTTNVAVGISLPFNSPSVFKSTYTTKDAIKANLINFFLTNKNERYLNPNYGSSIRNYIFEQITESNIKDMEYDIKSQIEKEFTNINILELSIKNSQENSINILLSYNINNTKINDELNILLS